MLPQLDLGEPLLGRQVLVCRSSSGPKPGRESARRALRWKPTPPAGSYVSTIEASLSVINLNFGLMTMMSVPYLFKLSGLACALGIVAAVTLCSSTAFMLGLVLEHARKQGDHHPDLRTVGEAAFGPQLGVAVGYLGLIDCFFFVVVLIMLGINAPLCIPGVTANTAIGLAAFLAALLDWLPQRVFTWAATVGPLITVAACCLVVGAGLALPESPGMHHLVARGGGTLKESFAVGFYGCAFHVYYPGVFNSVASRQSYNTAILVGNVAFVLLTCCFGMAVMCMFGEAIQPTATQNVARGQDLRPIGGLQWMSVAVGAFVVAKNFLTLKPGMKPIIEFLTEFLALRLRSCGAGATGPSYVMIQAVVPFPCYALVACGACFLTEAIIEVESLIALLLYSVISVLFPVACYVRLLRPGRAGRALASAGLAAGSAMLCLGAADALRIDYN